MRGGDCGASLLAGRRRGCLASGKGASVLPPSPLTLIPLPSLGGEETLTDAALGFLIPTFSEADSFLGFPKRSISESMSRTAWRLVWEQRFRFGRTTVRMT